MKPINSTMNRMAAGTLLTLMMAGTAGANMFTSQGFSSRAISLGGACSSLAGDTSGSFCNPSLMSTQGDGMRVDAGFQYVKPVLNYSLREPVAGDPAVDSILDEFNLYRSRKFESASTPQHHAGYTLGVAQVFRKNSKHLKNVAAGLGLFVPSRGTLLLKIPNESSPFFLDYDLDPNIIIVMPALSAKLTDSFHVGVGASVLVREVPIDANLTSTPLGNVDSEATIKVPFHAAPSAGLLYKPSEDFSVGLSYTSSFYMKLCITADVQVDIARIIKQSVNIDLNSITQDDPENRLMTLLSALPDQIKEGVIANITTTQQFTPARGVVGANYRFKENILVTTDLVWMKWSEYVPPFNAVRITIKNSKLRKLIEDTESLMGTRLTSIEPQKIQFKDTINPMVGVEYRVVPDIALRAGYAYKPTPVPDQTGISNILDSDKQTFSAGFGYDFGELSFMSPGRMGLDAHAAYTVIAGRSVDKDIRLLTGNSMEKTTDNPGYPGYSFSGTALNSGLSLNYSF
jgi:hypothetical protein